MGLWGDFSRKINMRIYQKLIIIFLSISILPIFFIIQVVYYNAKDILQREILFHINTAADLEAERIDTFLKQRINDLEIIRRRSIIRDYLLAFGQPGRDQSNPAYLEARKEIDFQLKLFQDTFEYVCIMLMDKQGNVVYTSNPAHELLEHNKPLSVEDPRAFQKAQNGIFIDDLRKTEDSAHPYTIFMIAAVNSSADKLIGFVTLEIDMAVVYKFMQHLPGLGKTWEALLVRKGPDNQIIFLSPLKYGKKEILENTIISGAKEGAPAQKAVLGESGSGISIDYRGRAVLSAWRPIPLLKWALVAKIDLEEVFLPIGRLRKVLFAILITAILSIVAAVLAVAKSISDPIRRLHRGTEIIGEGNLDYKVGIDTKDEIGQLSRAFDAMTAYLKTTTTSIENLNQEIKERKKVQEELKKAAIEWQRTFDSIADLIFIQDADSRILKANKSFLNLLKLKPEEVIGRECFEVVHKLNHPWVNCPFVKSCSDHRTHEEEVNDHSLGVTLLITTSPIFNETGEFIGCVHTARDISQVKQYQHDLEKKNKELEKLDQLKSDFVSIVSHELRTPLSIIKEGISLVLDQIPGKTNPNQDKILNTSKDNIDRLARIINNLLDISKVESGKIELAKKPVDINELARKAVSIFEAKIKERKLEAKLNLADGKLNIVIDEDRIFEVLINLISNSLKFTNQGYIAVEVIDKGQEVECIVADSGTGIDKENIPKLFNKFIQFGRRDAGGERGTGLGLSIAKGLVDLHGGKIWVEAELGKWTKVHFTLPK